MSKRKTRKYWYFTTREECVLCGKEAVLRERRYGRKPKRYWNRNMVMETACGRHFL